MLRMTRPLKVLYNDTCPICSREVDMYKSMTDAEHGNVTYCGLSTATYADYGLSADDAARRFYVVSDGQLVSGMDAFSMLWRQSLKTRWMATVTGLPVLRQLTGLLYDHVAAPILFTMHKRRERLGKSEKQG